MKILYIACIMVLYITTFAQVRIIKPIKTHSRKTTLAIGGGVTRSVLFLARNVKENNDAIGYNACILYGGEKILRGSLEFTSYRKINIEPTWYNIEAYTIETNAHFLAHLKKTTAYFYPLVGVSYNSFSGYFTGKNDFLNLGDKYKKNETAITNWLGLNIGVGYEQFFKRVSIFGEYKMRVGISDGTTQLNIMDVCFSFGVRYNLRVPSIYQIFKGTKSRYILDSKEVKD